MWPWPLLNDLEVKHQTQSGPVRLSPLGFRNLNQEPQRPRGSGFRPGLLSGACFWLPLAALLCSSSAFASYPSPTSDSPPHPPPLCFNPTPFLLLAIKILLTHFWLPKKDQRRVGVCVYYNCFSLHCRSCNFTSRTRLSPPLPIFHNPQRISCCFRPTKPDSEKSSKLKQWRNFCLSVMVSLDFTDTYMCTYICACVCAYT